ncbi:MAG: hypothetical protein ACTS2F_08715 [Thainema sp.]
MAFGYVNQPIGIGSAIALGLLLAWIYCHCEVENQCQPLKAWAKQTFLDKHN